MKHLDKEGSTEITKRHRKRVKIREGEDEREKWVVVGRRGVSEKTSGGTQQQLRKRKFKARTMNNRVVNYNMAGHS